MAGRVRITPRGQTWRLELHKCYAIALWSAPAGLIKLWDQLDVGCVQLKACRQRKPNKCLSSMDSGKEYNIVFDSVAEQC